MNPLTQERLSSRRRRVLFAVPEGDLYARQFALVATTLVDVDCRFVGVSWSTGRLVRRQHLDFVHLPWTHGAAPVPSTLPPVAEFVAIADRAAAVPRTSQQAFSRLSALIEAQFDEFRPHLVVYGPIEHAVCYLADAMAQTRDVKRLGIQPSFLANHFIVNHDGPNWEQVLRAEHFGTADQDGRSDGENLPSAPAFRVVERARSLRNAWLWIRGAEYLARTAVRPRGFHTRGSFLSLLAAYLAPRSWFAELPTVNTIDEVLSGNKCVLVALNQTPLSWLSSSRADLIEFALASVPPGVPIVLRPHPSERPRPLPTKLTRALIERDVHVSRAGRGPTLSELMGRCRAVLTLNSAVGMEALILGIPVFSLGAAYYARPGMAHAVNADDVTRVQAMLANAGRHAPVTQAVEEFLSGIMRERMVSASAPGSKAMAKRVHRALDETGHDAP